MAPRRGGGVSPRDIGPAELRAEAVRLRMAAMRRASHADECARALAESYARLPLRVPSSAEYPQTYEHLLEREMGAASSLRRSAREMWAHARYVARGEVAA